MCNNMIVPFGYMENTAENVHLLVLHGFSLSEPLSTEICPYIYVKSLPNKRYYFTEDIPSGNKVTVWDGRLRLIDDFNAEFNTRYAIMMYNQRKQTSDILEDYTDGDIAKVAFEFIREHGYHIPEFEDSVEDHKYFTDLDGDILFSLELELREDNGMVKFRRPLDVKPFILNQESVVHENTPCSDHVITLDEPTEQYLKDIYTLDDAMDVAFQVIGGKRDDLGFFIIETIFESLAKLSIYDTEDFSKVALVLYHMSRSDFPRIRERIADICKYENALDTFNILMANIDAAEHFDRTEMVKSRSLFFIDKAANQIMIAEGQAMLDRLEHIIDTENQQYDVDKIYETKMTYKMIIDIHENILRVAKDYEFMIDRFLEPLNK